MSQRVPSWDIEDDHNTAPCLKVASLPVAPSKSMSDVPILDYEVAELTWKNGQLAMHGLGPPRVVYKPHTNTNTNTAAVTTWDKPRASETLETIVNQAILKLHRKPQTEDLVPWLDHHSSAIAAGGVSMTMDALVPSSGTQAHDELLSGTNTRVGSCSTNRSGVGDHVVAREWSSQSASGSETFGMESSRQLTVETGKRELGVKPGFTSTSMDDTISGKRSMKSTSPDEHDSVCHSRPPQMEAEEIKKKGKGKSSTSTKRSRAAAIHNLSERRRRDKINQKMKTLQKLVPNANKTDKASMLDEVIEYLRQLQAQVHMINRMSMMMPLAMQQQQQLQMAMMNPMVMGFGMGMGMGMPGVMDLNTSRPNIPGMPPVYHPSTFVQPMMTSWDVHAPTRDQVPNQNHDAMAAFLACQSQPMTMEGYSRMVALFQQMQNQQPCGFSGLKN